MYVFNLCISFENLKINTLELKLYINNASLFNEIFFFNVFSFYLYTKKSN